MRKTVVAIRDRSGVGKSLSLRRTIDLLVNEHGGRIDHVRSVFQERDTTALVHMPTSLLLGITTKGDPDPVDPPAGRVRYLMERRCHLILCATRKHGDTYKGVVDLCTEQQWRLLRWSTIQPQRPHKTITEEYLAPMHDLTARAYIDLIQRLLGPLS